jgi:PKD repeat protein
LAQPGAEVNVFGPQTFTRTTGQPNVFTHHFLVPGGVISPFTVKIHNGRPDGTARVSAASIVVNGVEVVQEKELNQRVGHIEKNLSLMPNNTVLVRLRSAPGSFVTLRVTGVGAGVVGGLPGAPNTLVNGNLPTIPFPAAVNDNFTADVLTGLLTSRTRILMMFRNGVTIGQANASLQAIHARVLGTIPSINLLLIEIEDTGTLAGIQNALTILRADPHVAFAIQDTHIGLSIIPAPSDFNSGIALGPSCQEPEVPWEWPGFFTEVPMLQAAAGRMNPPPVQDGNWGLEASRTPQMWNLHDVIERSGRRTVAGIFDGGFQGHVDLAHLAIDPGSGPDFHGNHVAGTIGGTFDNRANDLARGVDGMNPFATMIGVGTPLPAPFSHILPDLESMLARLPQLRVINMSLGFGWDVDPNTNVFAQQIVIEYGVIMRLIAAGHPNTMFVPAAGNNSARFPLPEVNAKWSSPMNWAALEGPIMILPLGILPPPAPPLPPLVTQPSPPTAKIRASVVSGSAPLEVQFFAEGFDPDGGEVSFAWDLDGDGATDSAELHPRITYTTPGKRTVVLTVQDNEGATSTASVTIEVATHDPAVQITLPLSTLNPLTVQFAAQALDPDGGTLSFHWDFGDGMTLVAPAPQHTYANPGTFTVHLTVADDEGNASESMMTITVLTGGMILPPAPNIIVVEAIQNPSDALNTFGCAPANQFCKSDFSDLGGHIAAPGKRILSTTLNNGYESCSGTSMAAPHVTGLIGYLLAFDPTFTVQEIRGLVTNVNHSHPVAFEASETFGGRNPRPPAPPNDVHSGAFPPGMLRVALPPPVLGPANRIDAFATVLGIDTIRPGHPVQRALVDVDDGTIDGNDRTMVADARGDERVSMRDFRRFRDAYLIAKAEAFPEFVGEIALSLRDATSMKNDLNRDGCVQELGTDTPTCMSDENVYPRFDFNGNGVLDDRRALVNGANLLDVEVLADVGLWDIVDRIDDVRLNEEVSADPADELAPDINPYQDIVITPTTAHWVLADRDGDGRIDYLYSCDLTFELTFAFPQTNALDIAVRSGLWSKHLAYDSTFLAPIPPRDPPPLPGIGTDRFMLTVPLYEQAPPPADVINGHIRPPGTPQKAFLSIRGLIILGPPFAFGPTTVDIQQDVCTHYGEDVTIQLAVP